MRIGFVIADIRNDRVTPWPSRKRAGTVLDSKQILIGVGAAVAAIALNWLIGKLLGLQRKKAAQAAGQVILDRADQDAKNRLREAELEAKEQMIRVRADTEKEMAASREELREREHTLEKRQESVEQQGEDLRKQEQIVEGNQRRLTERLGQADSRREELDKLLDTQRQSLHELSGLNREQATDRLLTLMADELSQEVGTLVLKHHKEAKEACDQQARDILLTAMQRYASAHTADSTTSTVDIPNDEMKGRIIGREGRNIRAFEKATGIDVIIDDTPGVVIVSGFDPVRREIGRQSLNQLIADGRIHPSRIEEVVKSTSKEIDQFMEQKGQEAAQEVNVLGLPQPVIAMLGRLHFRTSYSQNVLRHSIEVSHLSGMLAEMVGLDGDVGRRCGLLHDIGKAADHELEGGHPKIGADLLKRHKESVEVVHAAFGHHDEIITEYPYTMLVATADACSASRPGARRESLERYIKRMEELETIAKGFSGVEQAFAIQAGRELRVLASARETNDQSAAKICRDIAKAFEEQLTYPGEIKVTVVRESRFSEIAR
ncbi:MAG: ribonuclease Y [Planctomycetaceae bacterium]|nr:ribonuclease Y [Planctomycetaceae bacterium]